jgi:hypothetical protein
MSKTKVGDGGLYLDGMEPAGPGKGAGWGRKTETGFGGGRKGGQAKPGPAVFMNVLIVVRKRSINGQCLEVP